MKTTIRCLALLLAAALAAPAAAEPLSEEALTERLKSEGRPAEDRARDADRKPSVVVRFLGIEPGMTVLDLIAGAGYYTEVLAAAVGPEGTVYAQNPEAVLKMREGVNEKALSARLAGNRLPNVKRLDREMDDLGLEPGSVDVALTALNFHDVYNARGPESAQRFLEIVHELLSPGGVLGLVDHAGNPDPDNEKLHRIEERLAVETARKAGFEVEATSDALRHPEDDRTRNVFEPGLRGQTDRFVLRLRKPQ